MRGRQPCDDVRHAVGAQRLGLLRDEAVPEPDEEIADVDRGTDAVRPVNGLAPVPERVVIFDVVMHQGGLVQGLDRHGDTFHGRRDEAPEVGIG